MRQYSRHFGKKPDSSHFNLGVNNATIIGGVLKRHFDERHGPTYTIERETWRIARLPDISTIDANGEIQELFEPGAIRGHIRKKYDSP